MSTPVTKRLMREAQMMMKKPVREFTAYPLESNLLEWHFTLRGPDDSPYAEGLYHGRVMVPTNYPFAPPDVVLITPNGRFELERKICLSISSYHPENWQSTWGIATVLTALRDFMLTPGNNGIGAVEYPAEVRQQLAKQSRSFCCPDCKQKVMDHLEVLDAAPPAGASDTNVPATPATPFKPTGSEVPPSPFDAGKAASPPQGAGGCPTPLQAPAAAPSDAPVAGMGEPAESAMMGPLRSSMSIAPSANDYDSPDATGSPPKAAVAGAAAGADAAAATTIPAAPVAPVVVDRPVTPAASATPAPADAPADPVGAPVGEAVEAPEAAEAAPPVVPEAPPAPEPRVAIRRRAGGVEVQLSSAFVDTLLMVVSVVFAVMLLKKALLDAPRPETSTGALVQSAWTAICALVAGDGGQGGPLTDADF